MALTATITTGLTPVDKLLHLTTMDTEPTPWEPLLDLKPPESELPQVPNRLLPKVVLLHPVLLLIYLPLLSGLSAQLNKVELVKTAQEVPI